MSVFHIRHSEITDFPQIMDIYQYARNFMAEHGNPNQWGPTNWPPEELIRKDIADRKGYVCEAGGQVVGVFFFDYGKDIEPTYRVIEGKWIDSSAYGVIHRLASSGSTKGVGELCIDWAYNQHPHLRVDTHPDNKVMQNLLGKLGFQQCGIIHVEEDEYPRLAYEKC